MLYRTTGTQPIFAIRREIDRLFDDTFGGAPAGRGSWVPAVDVREDAGAYRFDLELPGVDPDAVEVTADQGVLTVRGEKPQRREDEGDDGRMHVTERTFGSFARAFQLPQGVDYDAISAEFDRGLLSIRVPKRSRPEPRRIRVQGREVGQESPRGRVSTGRATAAGGDEIRASGDGSSPEAVASRRAAEEGSR